MKGMSIHAGKAKDLPRSLPGHLRNVYVAVEAWT
jgi:hypothetical protein